MDLINIPRGGARKHSLRRGMKPSTRIKKEKTAMTTFNFFTPTKIFFGENAVKNLGDQLKGVGKNILFSYGGGSIKKNGVYDAVVRILKEENKNIFELSGIMANPRTEKVYEGIKICKDNDIDFILAAGGGSVLDCSKFIAAGAGTDKDFWETFFIKREDCKAALPLGTILTMAGTGSEMDPAGVITHWESNQKIPYEHPLLFPRFSILDPVYTYSLPKNQLINGAIDTLSHIFEVYFSKPDVSNVSDDISEGIIKNVIENLTVAVKNQKDYSARANLMWASSLAVSGVVRAGKEMDWMSHQIEHALSACYDIPHGAGLAVVQPNYLKYIYKNAPGKFARFAKNIWNIDGNGRREEEIALEGIEKTRAYFKSIGAPVTLQEVGIPESSIDLLAGKTNPYPTSYAKKMSVQDVKEILALCLK
jgi:alcohol dehydrogenase YqhD (iron-dependent ADH family)